VNPVPRWAVWTTFLLSLAGFGIAGYLTFVHFAGVQYLTCSDNSLINCAEVTTSAQSYFLGIPVAVLGLCQYSAMVVLNSPFGWSRPERFVHVTRFVLAAIGLCFILWLVAAELLIIGHICLWCTGVHLVTLALFLTLTRVSPQQLGWMGSND
jgi:uncharacterized membrane protein